MNVVSDKCLVAPIVANQEAEEEDAYGYGGAPDPSVSVDDQFKKTAETEKKPSGQAIHTLCT